MGDLVEKLNMGLDFWRDRVVDEDDVVQVQGCLKINGELQRVSARVGVDGSVVIGAFSIVLE